jgi:flagellar hook-length control protein FliK
MNATPVVSLAPSTPDLTQIGGGTAADSVKPAGNGQDFAAALSDVGAKSARKPSLSKSHDGGDVGRQLPATGNDSPPPATPAQTSAAAMNAAAAEAAASKAAASKAAISAAALSSATAAANSAAAPSAAAASSAAAAAIVAGSGDAGRQTGASGAAAIAAAQAEGTGGTLGPADAANTGAAFGQSLGLPADAQPTDQSALPSSMAQAIRNVGAGHVPGSAHASAASRSPNVSAADGKVQSAGRGIAAANGASAEVNDADDGGAPSVNPAPSGGAQAAPTAAAVAMSAAANSTVAPDVAAAAKPSSSSADDSTTPVEGGTSQQAAGTAGLPAPALAAPSVLAAAAAKAAASAQALTALANAAASDKHAGGGSGDSLASTATSTAAGAVAGSAPTGSSGSADAVPVPTLKVAAGVDTAEFGQGVADRVSYMVDNNLSGAKLQINPPQLGPIEVRIAVQGDHAQVWLTSHSAVTRDALESSTPKLREMLGSQGFGQVSVDISQRSFQERPSQAQTYDWTPAADRSASAAQASTAASPLSRISSSAVDAYA